MRPPPAIALAAALAILPASCREPATPPPPAATAAYSDLEFEGQQYSLDGEAFTGRAIQDFPGGQREMDYRFKDGLLDGVAREWLEDGTQKTETHFRAGKRHGPNTYWNPDGSLHKEQVWEDGKLVSAKTHDH
ncbi:hypothetical protein BH23VER1_BH23VER1_15570 [soil metagenome]